MELILIALFFGICGAISFHLFVRECRIISGKCTNGEALFFAILSVAGPCALFWALVLTLHTTDSGRDSFWDKPFGDDK